MSTFELKSGLDLPVIKIDASSGSIIGRLQELWQHRELLYFFVWRDVKVRYKQTAIGAAWSVIQPLLTVVTFTIVFNQFAKMPSDGIPYPVFSYAALLPWNYFAKSLNGTIGSVVNGANLITKVYFPRLLLPVSAAVSGLVDFGISFGFLLLLMAWYGILPTWAVVMLPAFIALAMLTALSVGLWLAVINVRFRDVGQATSFLVQLWLFASPVAYPVSVVPQRWQTLYSLNPMAGVIEGFRWALLGKDMPELTSIGVSITVVLFLLVGGMFFFKRMENTFADIV